MGNDNLARNKITSNMATSVDIQGLVTSMREKVNNLSALSPKCCIFRVPNRLRQVNERAYTPIKVSIGPFHHGKDDLKPMEEHKLRYLKDFLQHSQKPLEYLVEFIKKKEESIREYYAETISFYSDKFVEIILVDAAFIIEVLLKYRCFNLRTSDDHIFGKPLMILDIWQDFLLLENQLPFFILNEFFEMAKVVVSFTSTFISFACNFLVGFGGLKNRIPDNIDSTRAEHFVDLVSSFLTPQSNNCGRRHVKTVTVIELHNAGIKFKASSSKNLFDITFVSGVLEIPQLSIVDSTECWIRNVLAYERCLYNDRYMTQYVSFLDNLIDSSKDVEYLVENGVIENMLGDNNDVSNLINKLGIETFLDTNSYYFSEICEKLNDYRKKPWHKWEATLKRDYFKTPWRVVSIVAAAILLSLTFIQAVCSIISVGN